MMNEPRIRPAIAVDVPAIAEIVDQAYRHYIARMGKPPGPMLDDYAARVSEGAVWVLERSLGSLLTPPWSKADSNSWSHLWMGVSLGETGRK
jgi:hypothetical protein